MNPAWKNMFSDVFESTLNYNMVDHPTFKLLKIVREKLTVLFKNSVKNEMEQRTLAAFFYKAYKNERAYNTLTSEEYKKVKNGENVSFELNYDAISKYLVSYCIRVGIHKDAAVTEDDLEWMGENISQIIFKFTDFARKSDLTERYLVNLIKKLEFSIDS